MDIGILFWNWRSTWTCITYLIIHALFVFKQVWSFQEKCFIFTFPFPYFRAFYSYSNSFYSIYSYHLRMFNFHIWFYVQFLSCGVAILDFRSTQKNKILYGTNQWLFIYSLGSIKLKVSEIFYFHFPIGSYVKTMHCSDGHHKFQ
jgi:hypothetical protein